MENFTKSFVNYDLDIHGVRLPKFEISNEYKHRAHVTEDCNNYDFLRKLAHASSGRMAIQFNSTPGIGASRNVQRWTFVGRPRDV